MERQVEVEKSSMLRSFLKTGVASALSLSRADKLLEAFDGSIKRPLVLSYHRVVEDFASAAAHVSPSMLTSCRMLELHLDHIARRYDLVTLDELGAWLMGDKTFSRPVAALTFDDGYRDVYENAFPLLKRKGLAAAVFVVTEATANSTALLHDRLFVLFSALFAKRGKIKSTELIERLVRQGNPPAYVRKIPQNAWTPPIAVSSLLGSLPQAEILKIAEMLEADIPIAPSALENYAPLTWDMVVEMHRAGLTIGSHTKTHATLINEDSEKVVDEIRHSQKELERKLNSPIRHIAYPDGQFNAEVLKIAAADYSFGYTTCRHRSDNYPMLTIPRLLLWENACLDNRGRFSPAILNCLAKGLLSGTCQRDHAIRPKGSRVHEFHL